MAYVKVQPSVHAAQDAIDVLPLLRTTLVALVIWALRILIAAALLGLPTLFALLLTALAFVLLIAVRVVDV
jgi:hypothetical protein